MVATTRSRSTSSSAARVHHHQASQDEAIHQLPPYESLRLHRIAENRARMAALGVHRHAASLTSFFNAAKIRRLNTTPRSASAKLKSPMLLDGGVRRSQRLKHATPPGFYAFKFADSNSGRESPKVSKRRPNQLIANTTYRNYQDRELRRPANAPMPKNCPPELKVSPDFLAYRCKSKERGTLYDAIVGICCHFCRQKKLCGEENCERCGQRDVTKPCLGKTDCSRCHSSTGVFCRACLKIRYGQELEEVQQTSDWLCPHCSEEEGLNPFWICNSSICLSKRKIAPTGIAIYKARELGFKSVAHYLANVLEKQSTACAA